VLLTLDNYFLANLLERKETYKNTGVPRTHCVIVFIDLFYVFSKWHILKKQNRCQTSIRKNKNTSDDGLAIHFFIIINVLKEYA
jgi:hypothetical protein